MPPLDYHRRGVAPVRPDEGGAIRVIAGHFGAGHGQKGVPPLVLLLEVVGHIGEVHVGAVVDDVAGHVHLENVLGVLKIDQIVVGIPIAGIFHVGECAQAARSLAQVGELDVPALESLPQGNKVCRFRSYPAVLGRDDSVGRPMAALRLVPIQGLAHRLPRGRPVVLALAVAQVDVPPRLIHGERIEPQPQEPSLGGRLVEAVPSGVIGNDGAVFGGAQIVAPRLGGVGAGDDVLLVVIVKVPVLHWRTPPSQAAWTVPGVPRIPRVGTAERSALWATGDSLSRPHSGRPRQSLGCGLRKGRYAVAPARRAKEMIDGFTRRAKSRKCMWMTSRCVPPLKVIVSSPARRLSA